VSSPADPPSPPAAVPPGRLRLVLRELRAWRPTLARMGGLLRSAVTSFIVLAGTLWLMPGVDANGLTAILWLVVMVACVGALLRPLLLALATVLGGLGALLTGASVQTIVLYVALRLAPDAHLSGLPAAFAASWIAVALAATVNWLADAGTDDAFVSETLRLMRKVRRAAAKRGTASGGDGLIIVQLDGVSTPLLRWAVRAGNLPNIGGWLRTRSHRLSTWHTGLPSTTPAAQAGILYGDVRSVPAFRWYEKQTGRLMVANRPRDAAEIERRLSDGHGLLRDGGASISNVFSGDAPAALFTISRAALPGRSTRGYAAFMTSPYGFTRAIVLGIGRLLKELYEARAQRLRNIRPRIDRSGVFLALRPLTGILREVNVSLLAEQMALGTPVIFCDFVDYDEVAHHAGPARPEALEALGRLDQVLGMIQRFSTESERRYHLVVLSDHGQSQGATFRQRFGESLAEVVDRLIEAAAVVVSPNGLTRPAVSAEATGPVESWGRVNALLTEIAGRPGAGAAATRAAVRSRTVDREVTLGPADEEARRAARTDAAVVVASGNLAMVYLARHPGRLTRGEIEAAYPGVVSGLAAHPGIGIVVVGTEAGPVAVGHRGEHHLRDGRISGEDPLSAYGPRARADLLRHQDMEHVGDLVLISAVDPATEEVSAFEELVGSHGGLGGWQTDAFLVHPADWPVVEDALIGPAGVHRQLVAWQRRLGLRVDRPPDPVDAASELDAAPDHTGELCDHQYHDDRDQDALPGLSEDGAAEDADAGVHQGP
jgi:Type I phosphodiesterase / nucleotide pyrophosphatase